MTLRYAQTVARFIDRPLLVLPRHAMAMWNSLSGRFGTGAGVLPDDPAAELIDDRFARIIDEHSAARMSRFAGAVPPREDGQGREPYALTDSGVGVLSVIGELVNRGAWLGTASGLVSYEGLQYSLDRLRQDSRVRSVILDVDSPGGEAVGFELAASAVRDLAAEKRVVAVVNGMAASAAYALVSGATQIVTPETGISGSIGVVMLHLDMSRALDEAGITPTLIFTGAHKVDANPFEPLPENVRQDLQAEANAFYDAFIKTVAKGRQGLTAQDARATQARTYIGKAAVDVGLVDQLGSFEDVLASLSNPRNRSRIMTNSNRRAAANDAPFEAEEDVPIIEFGGEQFADVTALAAQQREAGRAELAARIAEVLADDRSRGVERFAIALACENPNMAVERVLELTAMSAAQASSSTAPISERAKETGAEQVSSLPVEGEAKAEPAAAWDKITSALNARTSKVGS